MGGNALVLFLVVVEDLQLLHPIEKGHKADHKENPIDHIGGPPTVHKAQPIHGREQVIDKYVLNPIKETAHLGYIYPTKIAKDRMISSFFGKTKPITHMVLAVLLFLVYFGHAFLAPGEHRIEGQLPLELLCFGILLLAIFIINLTVRTEKITESNSYAALFFVLLTMAFPENLSYNNAILANFFVMLALWRLDRKSTRLNSS